MNAFAKKKVISCDCVCDLSEVQPQTTVHCFGLRVASQTWLKGFEPQDSNLKQVARIQSQQYRPVIIKRLQAQMAVFVKSTKIRWKQKRLSVA